MASAARATNQANLTRPQSVQYQRRKRINPSQFQPTVSELYIFKFLFNFVEKPPRKPRSTMGIPSSPSMPLREEKSSSSRRKERSRPISEHFGTISLSPGGAPPIDTPRQRQKSVDNAR